MHIYRSRYGQERLVELLREENGRRYYRLSGEHAYARGGYTNDGFKFVDLQGGPFLCVSGELYDIPGEIQSIDPDPDEAGALLISVS